MRTAARVIVIVSAAALLLTGCTSTAGAKPTSAPSAASVRSASPSAVGVPFTCADVAPQADLNTLAPGLAPAVVSDYRVAPPTADPWSASRVSLSQAVNPPSSPTVLSAFRSGYFGCRWADSAGGAFLEVSALPDAAAAFDAQTLTNAKGDDLRNYDALGIATKSSGGCSSNGDGGPFCRIDALAGTTWLAVTASASAGSAGADTIRTALVDIAKQTAARIAAATGLVSARPSVASRWDRVGDCTAITSAVATQQPGLPALIRGRLDVTDAYDPLVFAAIVGSNAFSCGGDPSGSVKVSVTPGADWLAPLVYADATPVPTEFATVTGLTAPRVLCVRSDSSTCWAEGYIDHALVVVTGLSSAATDAKALVSLATLV